MPPIISGRRAFSTQLFISSTALSPASMETPASAYAFPRSWPCVGSVTRSSGSGVVEHGERLGRQRRLEEVLAEEGLVGERDRVAAGEAGRAQPFLGLAGRLDHAVERDVAQAVGAH